MLNFLSSNNPSQGATIPLLSMPSISGNVHKYPLPNLSFFILFGTSAGGTTILISKKFLYYSIYTSEIFLINLSFSSTLMSLETNFFFEDGMVNFITCCLKLLKIAILAKRVHWYEKYV